MRQKSDMDTFIQFMISSSDKEKIQERMEKAGIQNMSAYMRKMALDGYMVTLDLSDLKEVLRLLRIAGNNMNQYAKQANINGSIYLSDIEILQREFREINEKMKDVLVKLSKIS